MAERQRWWTANATYRPMLDFYSGEVEFINMSWVNMLGTSECISASGTTAFLTWYLPPGFTAYNSGTANSLSANWVKFSATGAVGTSGRGSARVLTNSGRQLYETFDMRVFTGQ